MRFECLDMSCNQVLSFLPVLAAIGTVMGIFVLEWFWSTVNKMVPINDMAEDAVDKMYQSSGMPVMLRKQSTIPNKMIID